MIKKYKFTEDYSLYKAKGGNRIFEVGEILKWDGKSKTAKDDNGEVYAIDSINKIMSCVEEYKEEDKPKKQEKDIEPVLGKDGNIEAISISGEAVLDGLFEANLRDWLNNRFKGQEPTMSLTALRLLTEFWQDSSLKKDLINILNNSDVRT